MDAHSKSAFLFTIPTVPDDISAGAAAAIQMGALASQLVVEKRTRCVHPDGRAENDAEHSLMLAKVAPELARLLYPKLDENLVARFAALHDDVEAYVGDTPTDMLAHLDPDAKAVREAAGLKQLLKEYAHLPSYCERL
jgi:5'-deoxynucleotidase YfbR-like HD superfamily hydrolase